MRIECKFQGLFSGIISGLFSGVVQGLLSGRLRSIVQRVASGIVFGVFFGSKMTFVAVFIGCGKLTVFAKERHDTNSAEKKEKDFYEK